MRVSIRAGKKILLNGLAFRLKLYGLLQGLNTRCHKKSLERPVAKKRKGMDMVYSKS